MEVLFLSMFRGREDVYARRFYNKKKESSGYAPVCKNEWCDGICNKKAYRCNECPNRELSPLTADVAKAHLMGKDYLGRDVTAIYPMLENGTMQLLTRVLCGMETLTFAPQRPNGDGFYQRHDRLVCQKSLSNFQWVGLRSHAPGS